jgi:hypothetical protein
MPFWISHFVFRNVNIQIVLSDLENHHILILIKFSSFKIVVYLTSSREITQERVEYRIFFNIMSYRFVLILGSGIGISNVEISGIFESL